MAATSLAHDAGTIGLGGDGDDIDLIEAIEQSFQVRFGDETASLTTVGDLHEALVARIEPAAAPGLCATSMAFYRLRRALAPIARPALRIAPETRLAGLVEPSPRRLFAHLARTLEIKIPAPPLSALGWTGVGLVSVGAILAVAAIVWRPLWPALLLLPLGWALARLDPGAYGTMSVGDLARALATDNFDHFARRGADRRPDAVWRTLCALIEAETGFEAARIAPQTRFF